MGVQHNITTCSVHTSGYLTFNYTGCTVHSSKNQTDCYEAEAVIDLLLFMLYCLGGTRQWGAIQYNTSLYTS